MDFVLESMKTLLELQEMLNTSFISFSNNVQIFFFAGSSKSGILLYSGKHHEHKQTFYTYKIYLYDYGTKQIIKFSRM